MLKTADEVIQDIVNVLSNSDGQFIEEIANQVLTRQVLYVGDSMFNEEEKIGDL